MAKEPKNKPAYSLASNVAYTFRHFWRHDRSYLFAFIPGIFISVLLPLATDYYPKVLIDAILAKSADARILATVALYGLLLLVVNLINSACSGRINASRYVHRILMGNKTAYKIYSMDYENNEDPEIKDKSQAASNGADGIENTIGNLSSLFTTVLGIATYGVLLSSMSLSVMVMLVAYAVIGYFQLKYVRKKYFKMQDDIAAPSRKISYLYLLSMRYEFAKDIRLFNMSGWLMNMMRAANRVYMSYIKPLILMTNISATLTDCMNIIRDGIAYAVLIGLVLAGKLEVGTFVFFFAAVAQLSQWMSNLVSHYDNVARNSLDIGRLRAFHDLPDKFNRGEGAPLPQVTPFDIELRDLTYQYPTATVNAADDMNLLVRGGEKIAIVGVNGAGKTTLAKLLCGLYHPTSGAVLLNGTDARDYNVEEYYSLFSAVFQDIILFPVSVARFVSGNGEDVDRDRVRSVLEQAGLWETVSKFQNGMDNTLVKGVYDDGVELSGGEKQKLMLARALYKNAPVLILDEPTAALDPIAENELYMKYAELTRGKTTFYISHRLSSTRFCDRIIYIENGRIMENGSHEELMRKGGLYAKMFEVQSQYYKEEAPSFITAQTQPASAALEV